MIKETRLAKIQVVDEREPWAVQHGQVVVRWAMLLTEAGREVSRLEDYATMLTPDTDHANWAPSDAVFTDIGFIPPTAAMKERVVQTCLADHTPLVKARWQVNSTREMVHKAATQNLPVELVEVELEAAKRTLALLEGPLDMSLHQETRFNLAEILPSGAVQVRLRKCICENGEVITPPQYHRFVLEPGRNHAATFAAVNNHLAKMDTSLPPINRVDGERILRLCIR